MAKHRRAVAAAPHTNIADRLSDEIKLAHAIVTEALARLQVERVEEIAADLCAEGTTSASEPSGGSG